MDLAGTAVGRGAAANRVILFTFGHELARHSWWLKVSHFFTVDSYDWFALFVAVEAMP